MIGQFDIPQSEYRAIDALANSDALMIQRNPADYVWSKNAPSDASKASTADFGSAVHAALLEPEKYDDMVLVSSFASRTAKGFTKEVESHTDKLVLTDTEACKIQIMQTSAMAHPKFAELINAKGDRESSIIVHDNKYGVDLKVRPDIDLFDSMEIVADLKTAADISDWRSDVRWKNPLWTHGYGHTAAFYLHAMSLHYGFEINHYSFMVMQKSIELGRYPVAVFTITREELDYYGFTEQVETNIAKYAECKASGNWTFDEQFPAFYVADSMNIEISED
jgi:hypothetical protein